MKPIKRRYVPIPAVIALIAPAICVAEVPGGDTAISTTIHWPQFRGAHASGIAQGAATPLTWDVPTMRNIKWKTRIEGLGHSSPIIWGDRVFVTSCVSGKSDPLLRVGLYGNIAPVEDNTEHRWLVFGLDKKTGKILWKHEAHRGVPKVKRHQKATHANSTPVTDGKHVVALFGSEGLHCYDMNGKPLWQRDLGVLDAGYWMVPAAQWEYGSSPIIYKNMVIVQCDVQKNPFLAAFDITSGKELWRRPRNEACTWSTPTIYEGKTRTQLITNGYRAIGGYDPATGKPLWWMAGGSDIPVPTPIVAHDLIYIASSHTGPRPIYAIRPDATGDISLQPNETSNASVVWSDFGKAPYMQTPIVYKDLLYACRDDGVLSCYDARSGGLVYRTRLSKSGEGFTASPVAAAGMIYFTSEDGSVHVIQAGPKPETLAVNEMDEYCMATPAISEGHLFIRGKNHLFRIGK